MEWKGRYLLPEEKMQLQGFWDRDYDSNCVSTTMLGDLAGNAIGQPTVVAANIAMMAAFLDIL